VRPDRPHKSIGAEDTFFDDLVEAAPLESELERIGRGVWRRIEEKKVAGRTVVLKVKYRDFRIVTRSKSLDRQVAGADEFVAIGIQLLRTLLPPDRGIRLLGLTLSNLAELAGEPLPLLAEIECAPEPVGLQTPQIPA